MIQTTHSYADEKRFAKIALLSSDLVPLDGLSMPKQQTVAALKGQLLVQARMALREIADIRVEALSPKVVRLSDRHASRPVTIYGAQGRLLTEEVITFARAHFTSKNPTTDAELHDHADRLYRRLSRLANRRDDTLPFKIARVIADRYLGK